VILSKPRRGIVLHGVCMPGVETRIFLSVDELENCTLGEFSRMMEIYCELYGDSALIKLEETADPRINCLVISKMVAE
jgi:hypothetical protein